MSARDRRKLVSNVCCEQCGFSNAELVMVVPVRGGEPRRAALCQKCCERKERWVRFRPVDASGVGNSSRRSRFARA